MKSDTNRAQLIPFGIALFFLALLFHRVASGSLNLVTFGLTGHTPVFLFVGVLVSITIIVLKARKLVIKKANILPLGLALGLWGLIFIHQITSADSSLQNIIQVTAYLLTPSVLYFYSFRRSEDVFDLICRFGRPLIWASALLSLYALYEIFSHFGTLNIPEQNYRDYFSLVHTTDQLLSGQASTNAILEGRLLGLLSIFSLIVYSKSPLKKWLFFLFFLYFIEIIGNRQAFFGAIIAAPLVATLNRERVIYFKALLLAYSAALASFLAIVVLQLSETRVFQFGTGGTYARIAFINDAFNNLDKVSFFGNGAGFFQNDISWHYPHNISIELAFNYGFLAFLLYWALVAIVATRALSRFLKNKTTRLEAAMFGFSLYGVFTAHLSGDITLNVIAISFLMGYLAVSVNRRKGGRTNHDCVVASSYEHKCGSSAKPVGKHWRE